MTNPLYNKTKALRKRGFLLPIVRRSFIGTVWLLKGALCPVPPSMVQDVKKAGWLQRDCGRGADLQSSPLGIWNILRLAAGVMA